MSGIAVHFVGTKRLRCLTHDFTQRGELLNLCTALTNTPVIAVHFLGTRRLSRLTYDFTQWGALLNLSTGLTKTHLIKILNGDLIWVYAGKFQLQCFLPGHATGESSNAVTPGHFLKAYYFWGLGSTSPLDWFIAFCMTSSRNNSWSSPLSTEALPWDANVFVSVFYCSSSLFPVQCQQPDCNKVIPKCFDANLIARFGINDFAFKSCDQKWRKYK